MNSEEIIKVMQEHSLTVRCLPNIVVHHWSYKEGDEHKERIDSNGNSSKSKYSVIVGKDNKKLLREERRIGIGGWWYVKPTPNTDSIVHFRSKNSFFASTLEEAIQLYLNSLK